MMPTIPSAAPSDARRADLVRQLANWSGGVKNEIAFWDSWFASRGLSWPEEFAERMDPSLTLDPVLEGVVKRIGKAQVSILDVGSGPVTSVGKVSPRATLQVRACDPLAAPFGELYDRYNAHPPVRTEFAIAEDLSCFFEASSFDIVHCRNALDHSFDPVRGIVEMLKVVRVGGFVVLRHHPNEAVREDYVGFHQFNFDVEQGRFRVWNRKESLFPERLMPVATRFEARNDGYVEVVVEKLGEFPRDDLLLEPGRRLGDLYSGLIGVFAASGANDPDPAPAPVDVSPDPVSGQS